MASVLSDTIINNSKEAVDAYITKANSYAGELQSLLDRMTAGEGTAGNFTGEASNGYMDFYKNNVIPALTTNLTTGSTSLMESIKSMLESIRAELLGHVDPTLGDNNRNAATNVPSA